VRYFARTTRYRKAWLRKGEVAFARRELVATREFFPDRWKTSVRQKARWMLGISYMGWRQLGWFGSAANRYFLFRDRKSLFTAPTGVLAYILVLNQLAYWLAEWIDPRLAGLPPLVDRRWLQALVFVNFGFLINRLFHRLWFTQRTHGRRYVWLAPVRMVVANLIAFGAFARSMRIFLAHLITGRSITWDKTDHAFPSASEVKLRQGRLGDVLRFWNHVEAGALEAALREQKRLYRPLGLLLLDRGAVSEQDLAEAFAEQAGFGWGSLDLRAIDPVVLERLTYRQAGRFAAVPVRLDGDRLVVALGEPLSKPARAELEALLLAPRDVTRIDWRYAPLADIAFAVRWAWTPEGLSGPRATMALLRRLNLIDAGGEARLWAAMRAKHVRLGDLLVRSGAVDHKTLQKALAAIEAAPTRLGEHLMAQRQIDTAILQAALARQGTPQVLDTAIELGMIDEAEVEAVKARASEPA
jgi:adsorption protein B